MAVAAVALPYIMAATAVYSAVETNNAGKKAAKGRAAQVRAQQQQAKLQLRIDNVDAARRRVRGARATRIARAEAANTRVSSASSSSGFFGHEANIQSQYTSAVSASRQKDELVGQISVFNQQQAGIQASLFGSAARSAGNANNAQALNKVVSIFN